MDGLQLNLYLSISVTWFAALATLSLRVLARRITGARWWLDDYFSVLAFIFATCYCAILIPWTSQWSLGKLMPEDLDEATRDDILYHAGILGFFNSLCYASSLAASKISILSFYWRIFNLTAIRIPILVLLVVSTTWWIFRTFMLVFRCVPTQAIWDKTITDAVCHINSDKFFLSTIATHFLIDVAILALPMVPISTLRVGFQQKLAVVCFFLLGIIVCVASCIVLIILVQFPSNTTQLPYDYAMFCAWGAVEVNIAVASGCCPLLRPVFRRLFPEASIGIASNSRPSTILRLITITESVKTQEADESGLTNQMVDLGYISPNRTGNNKVPSGVHTMISSGSSYNRSGRRKPELESAGIHVHNETVVEVQFNQP